MSSELNKDNLRQSHDGKIHWNAFQDIAKAYYSVDVEWGYLEKTIQNYEEDARVFGGKFEINPDFQRGHVWSMDQRIAYIEWILRGGETGMDIYWNHPNWQGSWEGDMVLVDGLQRLTSVRMFLNNEFPVFGNVYRRDLGDRIPHDIRFRFHIAKLKTRAEILKWYLDFNAGGTPHSDQEIERVRQLHRQALNGVE